MVIRSVNVRSKIVYNVVKAGKLVSYYKLAVAWSEWSDIFKAECEYYETVSVPEELFNAVEEGDDILITKF